ncbi:hypothetical protein JHK82_022171 [Glycine max]|nr:hypothetical protein JHK85_022653 [Glycine max]KAG5026282.1 hypothetical protein JHK86_022196 [Glycine max]KAG5137440.1 hypothetical protein JHK82_022171 [Glycine max]
MGSALLVVSLLHVLVTWCNSRYDCLAKGRGMMFWVEIAILALCKAIRLVISHEGNTEGSSRFLVFLSNEFHSEAVERLLSSEKFINAIYKAVESIPEGQVCGCIRQITEDISESLRWMKDFCPLVDGKKLQNFNLQGELLGRGLSRLYCLVLGSVIITNSNRNLLGVAVNELMALVRPYLSILVGQQPDTICKFFSSVIGETVDQVVRKGKVLKKFGRSSQWVLVFFFQLFVSCQSLYRQASLRPPDLPKMSAEVEDYTTYSASELMERIDKIDFGYFSWIVQPSSSLLVVMQFISDIYLKLGSDDSSPLIYIFQSMALRRLVYLNKQIKLFKYLKKKHYLQKKSYRSQIKTLKEEAADLTNFILEYLSCVYQSPIFVSDYVTCEDVVSVVTQSIQDHIKERCNQWDWDLGVYAANKKSLPTLIWSKLCKNVDIWSNHASKKQLKTFFSHLLHAYLHSVTSSFQEPGVQEIDKFCSQESGLDVLPCFREIGKYQIVHAFSISKEAVMPCEEISNHKISHEENHLLPYSQDSPKLEALKCLTFMAENLRKQIQSLLVSVHNTPCNVNVGFGLTYENINRLSSSACCFSRLLWGLLTSSTDQTDAKDSDEKEKVLMWKSEHASELDSCISSLMELTNVFSVKLSLSSTNYLSSKSLVSKANALVGTQNESKAAATCCTSSAVDNVSKSVSNHGRMLNPNGKNYVARVLARVESTELQGLNKPLLQSLVKGDHPEIAFLLRQLLIVFSSLLRLNFLKDDGFLPSSFVPTFIEISQVLLLEFTEMVAVPQYSALLLLDGACNYLRELAGYFPFTYPTSSRKVYRKLIQIHMRAIGETISLQGKRATLTFHERQSSTKSLHKGSVEAYSFTELHCFSLDEFKIGLRNSFKAYIERPSELHLLSTIQAIERSLMGDGARELSNCGNRKVSGDVSSHNHNTWELYNSTLTPGIPAGKASVTLNYTATEGTHCGEGPLATALYCAILIPAS